MSSFDKKHLEEIRKKAEKIALNANSMSDSQIESMTLSEISILVHELNIHQIELEMQKDELETILDKHEALQKRYFDLYDLAPVGYITLNKEGLIFEANSTAASLLCKSLQEIKNSRLHSFVLNDDMDCLYFLLKEIFDNETAQSCELRLKRHGDAPFWVNLDGIMVPQMEKGKCCRMTINDIDLRKKQELEKEKINEKLLKMQKLESIGILAGGIAHDFNNLLGGIFLNIEMANMKNKDPHIKQYLENTITSIDRARNLTQQLLTFSKGGTPVKEILNLIPYIEETVNFAISGTSNIVKYTYDEDLYYCDCDKNQLAQVVDNLVINASQSMDKKGLIEIKAENLDILHHGIDTLMPGKYVKLSITDHGKGISEENKPFVFDPFFSTKSDGNGLGLPTCYSIIKRHGGVIDFESREGSGSTFYLVLPGTGNRPEDQKDLKDIEYKGTGMILFLDDDEMICKTSKALLESYGFEVLVENKGEDLLDLIQKDCFNKRNVTGIIMDLTIPGGKGGDEIIDEVRDIFPQTKIIVSSGYSNNPVMSQPEKYGFDMSIQKPFMLDELLKFLI